MGDVKLYSNHACIILNAHKREQLGIKDDLILNVAVFQEHLNNSVKYSVGCGYNSSDKCSIIKERKCLYHRLNK